MAKLVILDAGHGGSDPGATYKGRRESDDALKVVLEVEKHLVRSGVVVKLTRDIDKTVPLSERSKFENDQKADAFISIHRNACSPETASGVETFCYEKKGTAYSLAINIQNNIVGAGVNSDRGVKAGNFHVLRETVCAAALVELGFIDSTSDNKLFDSRFDSYCKAIAKGILKTLKIPYKEPATTEVWYRVVIDGKQIQAHKDLELAKERVRAEIDTKRGTIGQVQRNTDGAWLYKYFLDTKKTPILGESVATAEQMEAFLLKHNPNPKINCKALQLAKFFLEEGSIEGVRGDIAFCQAIKESGWFKFGNDVLPEQNNYCGLGTTGGGVKGVYFDTPQIGVRAQIQHLQAYACISKLKQQQVDPRYHLVAKGIAPNWEDLNGKWAVPGVGYGESIVELYEELLEINIEEKLDTRNEILDEVIDAINSLREEEN